MVTEMEVSKTDQRPHRRPYLAATCRMACLSNLVRRPGGMVPAPESATLSHLESCFTLSGPNVAQKLGSRGLNLGWRGGNGVKRVVSLANPSNWVVKDDNI